jgi:quinoprotein glucose dehydrogenase
MVYNPGTALGERWRRHFFVADFTGSPANSRINSFQLEESGAGFSLARSEVMLTGILGTGMQFGPDGSLYLADWITGWGLKNQGRIWVLDVEGAAADAARVETARLIAEEFGTRDRRRSFGV